MTASKNRNNRYHWDKIEDGGSLALPIDKYDPDNARKAVYLWGRAHGVKFTSKLTNDVLIVTRAPAPS